MAAKKKARRTTHRSGTGKKLSRFATRAAARAPMLPTFGAAARSRARPERKGREEARGE